MVSSYSPDREPATQQELGKYPIVYPLRAVKQEGALFFSRCAYFQLWSQNLNLKAKVGRGMAAPLVVSGRNTSLTNKNNLFFNWSVFGALTSPPHLCLHPMRPFPAASGPHDNPSRGRAPITTSRSRPGRLHLPGR